MACTRMRLMSYALLLVILSTTARAQIRSHSRTVKSVVIDFKTLPQRNDSDIPAEHEEKEEPAPRPGPPGGPPKGYVALNFEPAPPLSREPSSRTVTGSAPAPVATTFQSLLDNDVLAPPDTMGAVGPNHVMTALNSQVLIQNRTGGVISTVDLDTFWAATGAHNVIDPRITYDPYNGRWITSAAAEPEIPGQTSILLGVSQTSDPTGKWNLVKIQADPTYQNWADYPTLGFNSNWIVVAANMFGISSGNFSQSSLFIFRKSDLYSNAATDRFTEINDPAYCFAPAVTYDNSVSTLYLVQRWDGNSGGYGYVRISTITGPVGSEVLNAAAPYPVNVATTSTWGANGTAGGFAPQLGSGNLIDTNDDRIDKSVYRNGYLWFTHTVFLPAAAPTRSSVQWWQVTPTGTIVQRALIDDPTGVTFYAYPSIAVNKNNDTMIGYSRFSSKQYAGSDYSFRYASDPINVLQSDLVLKSGLASYFVTYGSGRNRWGDYSATVVDPVNDTDMWTLQEYAATPSGADDLWGTWWAKITVLPPLTMAITETGPASLTEGQTAQQYSVNVTNNGPGTTTGALTMTPNQSAGMTVTSITTTDGNWTCSLTSCTDPNSMAQGASTTFTLTYNVTSNASSPQTLSATVSGGGANSVTVNPVLSVPVLRTTSIAASNQIVTYTLASQPVSLSATVTPLDGGVAVNSGTVTFALSQNGNPVGIPVTSGTVSSGVATSSYALPAGTSAGIYSISATYNPGSAFTGSSDNSHSLAVNGAATTTTAANESAGFSSSPQNIGLSATVTSSQGPINAGTVTFTVSSGGSQIGVPATSGTVAAGSATATFILPGGTATGSYTITAAYTSAGNFASSSDSAHTLAVNGVATTTSATGASTTYSTATQNIILAATVYSGQGIVNAGTVTFTVKSGSTQIGTPVTSGTVTNGAAAATFVVPAGTAAGSYTILAVYNAAGGFATSSDNSQFLGITPASTTTTAANASATFGTANQNVVLTASVASAQGTVNGGTVTFTVMNGPVQIGASATSGIVSNGSASASFVLPGGTSVGAYTITAVYNASNNFTTSSDNTHSLTVNAASTTITAANESATYNVNNQNVTLAATVTSPQGTVNGGTVTFTVFNGGTPVGAAVVSGTVTNGAASATFVIPGGTAIGTYTITAAYGSSSNFAASSDSTHALSVNAPSVQVTISTNVNGPQITVDGGTPFTGSQLFTWTVGSNHSVVAATTQSGGTGVQYLWLNWSDGLAATHTVTAPGTASAISASFQTQYLLTTAVSPSGDGTITPSTGYINAGTVMPVSTSASATYVFTGFSGALTGLTNPQNLTLNAPATVTANFQTGPDPSITMTYSGSFRQGDAADTYTILVTNSGQASTSGTLTMTDTLPAGLTGTALSGPAGWTCTLNSLTCSTSNALGGGASATFTLTVSVASNATASVTNTATIAGGGDVRTTNNTATDVTPIIQGTPDLTITSSHSGTFYQGSTGTYTLTVTNSGTAPTSGQVTVTDTLPSGMSVSSLSGTGWTCTVSTASCTQTTALANGASYSPISLTVYIGGTGSSVTNKAAVSGGGETNTSNDTASDPTSIVVSVKVTVATSPSGLSIVVDGSSIKAPQTYTWYVGNTHSIATSNQSKYTFTGWSDGGAISHNITVPSSNTTYTASFK